MRYIQRWNDKPFEVRSQEVTRWACCDCGLVHDIAFVSGDGENIGVAARVNKRATAAKRRSMTRPTSPTRTPQTERDKSREEISLLNPLLAKGTGE